MYLLGLGRANDQAKISSDACSTSGISEENMSLTTKPKKILRRPAVEARTGLSRSTIYARILRGSFPQPISLGPRAVGWIESEIDEWIEGQIERTRLVRPDA